MAEQRQSAVALVDSEQVCLDAMLQTISCP